MIRGECPGCDRTIAVADPINGRCPACRTTLEGELRNPGPYHPERFFAGSPYPPEPPGTTQDELVRAREANRMAGVNYPGDRTWEDVA